MCWDGMTNDPDTHCNSWDNAQDTAIGIIISLSIVFLALVYICFRKREFCTGQGPLRRIAEVILAMNDLSEDEGPYSEDDNAGSFLYFHVFMMFASIYLAMVLGNWGSANITNNDSKTYDK